MGEADVCQGHLETDAASLQRSSRSRKRVVAHEQAQAKRAGLVKFTKSQSVKELTDEVDKARSDELAKKSTWELEKSRETELERKVVVAKGGRSKPGSE